nr:MAG TPA: hypothetical protein [Caudoviricetes sp.]
MTVRVRVLRIKPKFSYWSSRTVRLADRSKSASLTYTAIRSGEPY